MALSPLILVVDDTDAARRATVLVLEKAGFRVADAVDGTSALRCIPELSPDLVLLDAMLPDIGGIEVLRRLRADPRMAHLPVVILSSQLTQAADQAEGLDAGADGYIARPISNVELVARVRAMLRSQELSRQLRESEARFRELITQQTDGLLVVDAAGCIQFANPAAARIFGRRIEDLVGLPFGFPISSGTPVEIDGLEAGSSGRILEFFASATQWDLQPAHLISLRDITERKRSENLLALRARQQEVISRLGIEASRTISLDDIFRLATSRAAEALDMELCKVLQLSPDRSRLRLVAGVGWAPGVIGTATVSSERESQAGFALMQGIPVVSDDLANETRFRASPLLVEHQVRSGMSTLIYLRGTPWGVLGVHSRRPRQFSEQDSHFLQSVATLLSVVIERLAAAREQSASTQRMREAQRIAHLGSWELDIPTKKLSWSEEVFRMFGVEPSAFAATYEGFFAFVHPDDRDAMQTAQQAALSGGGALEIEHRIIRPDGSIRHVLERGELIHDDSGQPVALSGTVLDTTDLRAAQNRAERMNTLLTEAQQIANMGSWEMDLTSGKLVWSEETCRLFGIRPEEFGGTFETFTGLILPEDLTAFGAVHAEITPEAPLLEAEYRIRRPDGEVRWMFERGRVAFDAAGKAVRRQGVVMDVTERKRAEADLRESEQLLRIAGHIAHMGAWSVDFPDVRITWSDEVCAIHDMPAGTVPALDQALAFYTPESRPVIESAFSLCASEGTPFDVEIELLSAKKLGKWVRSIGQAERDQTGAIRRVHGAFQDISEQKKAQAEALRAAETLAGIVEVQQEIADVDLTFSDVLRRIAEHAMVLTGAAGGAVEMVDGSDMVYAATAGMVVDDVGPPKLEGGLSGVAVATGRVLCCDDTETGSRVDLAFCRALGVRAMIVAPLHVSGEIVGVLKVLSDRPGAFGKRDIHNLQILAETLGVVIQRHRAADALRASMEEFRRLAEAMPQIVWVTRADGWTTYFNQHWMDYTGLTLEESLGHGWNKPFHPDDQQRAWEAWQRATSTVGAYSLECRLRRADGQYRWWLIRGKPQQDAVGTVQKWFGTCTDIHDLKIAEEEITRSNRALTMLSRCNEALIRSESESGLLAAVCQIAVDIGGFRLAWVGYALDDAEKTIACQSHAGLGGDYLTNVRITWDENHPAGQGPAGRVIRHGEPVVIPDFESDEGFRPWLQAARAHGFRGTIALPLADGSRTFGVFVLYQAEVRQPLPDELRLLQELADDMAFGIVNLRARADRQRMHTAVEQVAASVSAAASTDFFEQLTRNMVMALGAKAGFVAKVLPGEPASSRTIAVVVDDQVTANFDYAIQGTPCENFFTSDTCVIHQQAAQQFPLSPTLAALGAEGFVGRRLDNALGTFIGQMVVIFREPLKDPDFVVSTLQIFSARAAAELERQETDTRLREQAALLDKAQDAIVVRDLDHRITYWNSGAERVYGWTAEESCGAFGAGISLLRT